MKNASIVVLIILASVFGTLYFTREEATAPIQDPIDSSATNQVSTTTSGAKLDYADKGYTEFPEDILSKTDATELDLSGNNLTGSLPAEIKDLKKLEILNVSDNNMTGIPAEIGQMTSLRIINYANNNITGLPNELGNLKNLEVFDLSGNNPSQQDLEGIRAKLPASVQIIL